MYRVPVEVRDSPINGRGVFANASIKKNTIVWHFTEDYDIKMTKEAFESLDASTKEKLEQIAYLSPTTGVWVIPPENDPACFTNHSPVSNNISVVFDTEVSEEPFFVANRDIDTNEEITNNYLEFDENSNIEKFHWLKP